VVRALAIAAVLAPAIARAEPRTWIGSDEWVGGVVAGDLWDALGAGLSARHALGRLELAADAALLRMSDDGKQAFSGRGSFVLGYAIHIAHKPDEYAGSDFYIVPAVGVSTAVVYGAGAQYRTSNGVFGELRVAFRAEPNDALHGPATARGIGSHVAVRFGNDFGAALVGYEWGP
jgi:hypothetical protein